MVTGQEQKAEHEKVKQRELERIHQRRARVIRPNDVAEALAAGRRGFKPVTTGVDKTRRAVDRVKSESPQPKQRPATDSNPFPVSETVYRDQQPLLVTHLPWFLFRYRDKLHNWWKTRHRETWAFRFEPVIQREKHSFRERMDKWSRWWRKFKDDMEDQAKRSG